MHSSPYHRQPHNSGSTGTSSRPWDLSSGEYCWLFGDDLLLPGMLAAGRGGYRRPSPALVLAELRVLLRRPADRAARSGAGHGSWSRSPSLVHGNDELVALRLHYFTFISSNVVLRVPEAIAATRHDDTRGFAHLFYILRVCRERTALLLPELAVVTQWTSERPAQPPPLPTFTIDLPAIFADVSRAGLSVARRDTRGRQGHRLLHLPAVLAEVPRHQGGAGARRRDRASLRAGCSRASADGATSTHPRPAVARLGRARQGEGGAPG